MKKLLPLLIVVIFPLILNGQCLSGDCVNGRGVYKYSHGRYNGEWKNGKRHGFGIMRYNSGGRYIGDWKNDKQHGEGTRTTGESNKRRNSEDRSTNSSRSKANDAPDSEFKRNEPTVSELEGVSYWPLLGGLFVAITLFVGASYLFKNRKNKSIKEKRIIGKVFCPNDCGYNILREDVDELFCISCSSKLNLKELEVHPFSFWNRVNDHAQRDTFFFQWGASLVFMGAIVGFVIFGMWLKDSTGFNLLLPFEILENIIEAIKALIFGGDWIRYVGIALYFVAIVLGIAILGFFAIGAIGTLFESLPLLTVSFDSSKYHYKVYKNPQNIYKAVKVGWSHPGFFFGFFWCLFKQLWAYAGIIFAIGLASGVLGIAENLFLDLIVTLGVMIWMGNSGNELYAQNLKDKGYDFLTTLKAKTPEGAIAQYQKDTQKDKED